MNWDDQRTRIRRFLRDPDGNIWSDANLLRLYNDAQRDLNQTISLLEDVQAIRVPPIYQDSYLYEWEWRHTRNTEGYVYQALNFADQSDAVYVAMWEPEHLAGANADTNDPCWYYCHPWEAWITTRPGNPPPVWADSAFSDVISIYWDKHPIDATSKKELSRQDRTWRTRAGDPQAYYRKDALDNQIIIWPTPTTVSWSDITSSPLASHAVTYDWEEDDAYFTGTAQYLTIENSDNSRWITYRWESQIDNTTAGFEYSDASSDLWLETGADAEHGIVLYDETDTADFGLVTDAGYAQGLTGAGVDLVAEENNVLMVFAKLPKDLVEETDISDYPVYMRKYIEYGVLETAYSSNTDGKIQSLEDYWGWRKQLAYKALKLFKSKKWADRDFRFRTKDLPARVSRRRPRLPDAYPAQW